MTVLGNTDSLPDPPESVQVLFRGVTPSLALEQDIRQRADELMCAHSDLEGCRVLLEQPHRPRHHRGKTFHVRIEMRVWGGASVVVTHESRAGELSDSCAAVREAFEAARLHLQELTRRALDEAGSA